MIEDLTMPAARRTALLLTALACAALSSALAQGTYPSRPAIGAVSLIDTLP